MSGGRFGFLVVCFALDRAQGSLRGVHVEPDDVNDARFAVYVTIQQDALDVIDRYHDVIGAVDESMHGRDGMAGICAAVTFGFGIGSSNIWFRLSGGRFGLFVVCFALDRAQGSLRGVYVEPDDVNDARFAVKFAEKRSNCEHSVLSCIT